MNSKVTILDYMVTTIILMVTLPIYVVVFIGYKLTEVRKIKMTKFTFWFLSIIWVAMVIIILAMTKTEDQLHGVLGYVFTVLSFFWCVSFIAMTETKSGIIDYLCGKRDIRKHMK